MTTLKLTTVAMALETCRMYPEQLRQNYFVDHDREILWILNRKNAGTSIREALGVRVMVQAVEAHQFAHYHTVTIIRHPWARLTSGLYNPYNGPLAFAERVQKEILDRPSPWHVDPHLWPQWVPILGFRVDRYICNRSTPYPTSNTKTGAPATTGAIRTLTGRYCCRGTNLTLNCGSETNPCLG